MNDLRATLASSGAQEYVQHYFVYQYRLGREAVVPYLVKNNIPIAGAAVLEIGCAEGGVLCAFAEKGAARCYGTDIAEYRLEQARLIATLLKLPCEYSSHNIVTQEPPPEFQNAFDIVILRDVIEHLTDTAAALKHTMQCLRPGGVLLITFPPYYSPYGGHQHTLNNTAGLLPFVQALPKELFGWILRGGRPGDIEEVNQLRGIRLTIAKMRNAIRTAGLEIIREDLYLLRPVFKMKFGLPTIRMNAFRALPFLREIASTEATYLLRKR